MSGLLFVLQLRGDFLADALRQGVVIRDLLVLLQIVEKVREVERFKINLLQLGLGDAATVRAAGLAKADVKLTVTSLLLHNLGKLRVKLTVAALLLETDAEHFF